MSKEIGKNNGFDSNGEDSDRSQPGPTVCEGEMAHSKTPSANNANGMIFALFGRRRGAEGGGDIRS